MIFRLLAIAGTCLVAAQPAPAQDPVRAGSSALASPEWKQFIAMAVDGALRAPDVAALERACVGAAEAPAPGQAGSDVDRCLKAAVDLLPDPATFMDAREVEMRRMSTAARPYGSIGIEIARRVPESGPIVVVSPLGNTPAERAGILPGDKIDAIDGVDITSLPMDQAVRHFRGKPGSVVKVSLLRGQPPRRISLDIPLEVINPGSVTARAFKPQVAYVRIRWFRDDTAAELQRQLLRVTEEVGPATSALVLDLRGCAGGALPSVLTSLSSFIPPGTVVGLEHRRSDDVPLEVKALAARPVDASRSGLALVVLIDGGTAVGAELFAQALKTHRAATLVGARSAGLTAVRSDRALPNGARVSFTEGELLARDKTSWAGRGIDPDVSVRSDSTVDYGAPGDEALDRALKQASSAAR